MGSYGAKWRHGWIPLNAQATALKLKQLRAGDRGAHSAEHHGGYHVHVAHTGNGRYGALVVGPSGASHYSAHATRATAIADAGEHVATMRGRDSAKTLAVGRGIPAGDARRAAEASIEAHRRQFDAGAAEQKKINAARDSIARRNVGGEIKEVSTAGEAKPSDFKAGDVVDVSSSHYLHKAGATSGVVVSTGRTKVSMRAHVNGVTYSVPAHALSQNRDGAKASGSGFTPHSGDRAVPTASHETHSVADLKRQHAYALMHNQTEHVQRADKALRERGYTRDVRGTWSKAKASEGAKVSEAGRAAKPGFSKQEMMLPGVRMHGGERVIVKPSVKMVNAGHKFPEVGTFSPLVEHDQFGVEHSNGAHLGHIDTSGGLHIAGPGLERHQVGNVKEAIAGLHANYTIRQREADAKKTAEAVKAESVKAANVASRAQREELAALAHRVAKSRGNTGYTIEQNILRSAQGSHEQRRDALKAMVAKYSASDLKPLINTSPAKPPRPVKSDTPTMIGNREKIAAAIGRSQPLELSGSQFGDDAHATIREGLPITHGGVAGHVIGVYGQTFDTYHPKDSQGRGGYYMRHEIRTRRGRKSLDSSVREYSKAG